MKKYFSLNHVDFDVLRGSVITIGMFDGVHLGHQQVIDTCCEYARAENLNSVLITFSNHPMEIFNPMSNSKLLTTVEERLNLLELTQLDYVFVLPFDKKLADISAADFVENILIEILNCKILIFGYDNHFGKNRLGSPMFIQHNFDNLIKAVIVNEQILNHEVISSSRIKRHIEIGEVDIANKCLGYDYFINSEVVHGNALGRTIGFPTANIYLPLESKVIPETGVYLTRSTVDNKGLKVVRFGLTNVGYRPTIQEKSILTIETYLFDFDSDIYDCSINVSFLQKIRNEIKFNSINDLIEQIQKDKLMALQMLAEVHITT